MIRLKRAFQFIGDVISHLSSAQTVWGFIKWTLLGHIVSAFVAAAGIGGVAIWRSDPWLTTGVLGLVTFVAVMSIAALAFKVNSRPQLRYAGIFNIGSGGFFIGGRLLKPLFVEIVNNQQELDLAANNVVATMRFTHHSGLDKVVITGAWEFHDAHGTEFASAAQIEGGQTRRFAFVYEDPQTAASDALGSDPMSEYFVSSDPNNQAGFKRLSVGRWNVKIELKSDNCAPVLLDGGVTITKTQRLNGLHFRQRLLVWE